MATRDLKSSVSTIALGMSSVVKFCRHTIVADHSGAGGCGRDGQRIGHGARGGGRGADCLIAVAVCAPLESPLPIAPRGAPSIAHSPLPPSQAVSGAQSAAAMQIQIQTQRNYAIREKTTKQIPKLSCLLSLHFCDAALKNLVCNLWYVQR